MYTVLEGCVMAKKKRVMLVLTDEMHEALNRQAARRGATLSGLVRSVLGEWLEELKKTIVPTEDSVTIIKLLSSKYYAEEKIGKPTDSNTNLFY